MNGGIINSVTRLHLVGCFHRNNKIFKKLQDTRKGVNICVKEGRRHVHYLLSLSAVITRFDFLSTCII